MTDTAAIKQSLRRKMLEHRLALAPDERQKAEAEIAAQLVSLLLQQQYSKIALYAPVKGEVDALHIGEIISKKMPQLNPLFCLPEVTAGTKTLIFRQFALNEQLEAGAYGIATAPSRNELMQPEIIITPLLAFDAKRLRLGYGGGYYDATFTQMKKQGHNFVSVGLGFAIQRVDSLPVEAHDMVLDYILSA